MSLVQAVCIDEDNWRFLEVSALVKLRYDLRLSDPPKPNDRDKLIWVPTNDFFSIKSTWIH